MTGAESERYWDERARENALFYVDNEIDYENPDAEAFWRRGDTVLDRLLDMTGLTLKPDATVLDVGCGVGRLTRALAFRVRHVYGLDVSQEMLNLAREHNAALSNVSWVHGDGVGLGVVGDASVDGCFSHVVFQHIPDPEVTLTYIREMGRVLRPGGWALFQVSTDPKVHRPDFRTRIKARLRRTNRESAWWGAAVEVPALKLAIETSGMRLERLLDEGTQFTTVLARQRPLPGEVVA